jgi:integrase
MPLEHQRGSVFVQGKRRKAWYGKYRVCRKDPTTNTYTTKQKTKKIGLKSEMTKFEAEDKLRDLIATENNIAMAAQSSMATNDVTMDWFVTHRHLPMMSCRETTKKTTKYEISRYILEQFGSSPLHAIGLFELQTHLNKLAASFSESVVRHAYVNLRSIFNNAVDLDYLAKSPARKLKMPDTRSPDRSTIGAARIMALLDAIENPMDKCAFAIGVFCALRTSELFGLTWDCWLGEYLAIKNTAFQGKLQENKVKTGDSRGLVPVPELVYPIIADWHSTCPDTSEGALMFPTKGKKERRGQVVPFDSTNFMERRIHPVAHRLKIPRGLVTFQVMRRTVGTDLQFHGTLKDAQGVLRHKSIKTTGNVYMQSVPSSVKSALNLRTEAVFKAGAAQGGKAQR